MWETPREGLRPFCQGKGLLSRGFRLLDEVLVTYRASSRETWRVQQMLFDSLSSGRLWPNFDVQRHVGEAPTPTEGILVGLDWGQSPGLCVGSPVDGVLWIVQEVGGPGVRLSDLRLFLLDLQSRYGEFLIWCGSHDQLTQPMAERWAADGLMIAPMVGQFSFRETRHDEIRRLLDPDPATGKPRLMFGENVPRTIRQVQLARTSDEARRQRTADDFRDALSYLVAGWVLSDYSTFGGGGFMM